MTTIPDAATCDAAIAGLGPRLLPGRQMGLVVWRDADGLPRRKYGRSEDNLHAGKAICPACALHGVYNQGNHALTRHFNLRCCASHALRPDDVLRASAMFINSASSPWLEQASADELYDYLDVRIWSDEATLACRGIVPITKADVIAVINPFL